VSDSRSETAGDPARPAASPAVAGRLPAGVTDAADVARRLRAHDYLADEGLATAVYLALALRRPLFLEGDAGVGKTAVAAAIAALLDAPLIRLQCYEGIDASQALYDWSFPRQVLHLRSVEAAGEHRPAEQLEAELYDRRFLVARPLLQALETDPAVLLIDEIDRADDEFEALLLEVLSDFAVSIPELGTVRAATPPVVVLTSNRTREVHDALKRRCYYHWVDHPGFEREVEIVRARLPGVGERLAREAVAAVQALRTYGLLKPPGVAETLDWTEALIALGADHLDPDLATTTLGSVLKVREDQQRARDEGLGPLLAQAAAEA
jgi:MoxR-like ATPase